jgi:adenylate kinase family enzyme
VIGSTGSGKTTFARALAQRLGVPNIELDALHWQSGRAERSADEVVWLDIPFPTTLWRLLRKTVRRGRTRVG